MTNMRERGNYFENQALQYLKRHGLKLLQRNFCCSLGEIDLIMLEQNILVFVEVRYRQNQSYGPAVETISYHKQQKIQKAAHYFLLTHKIYQKNYCRFDSVTIDGEKMKWTKNAFQC
jgi:putative endonuclease